MSLFLHNFHFNICFKKDTVFSRRFFPPTHGLKSLEKRNIIHTFTREHARAYFCNYLQLSLLNCSCSCNAGCGSCALLGGWIHAPHNGHCPAGQFSEGVPRSARCSHLFFFSLFVYLGFFRKKRNEIVFKNCVHFVSSFCVSFFCFKVRFVLTNGSTVLFNLISLHLL